MKLPVLLFVSGALALGATSASSARIAVNIGVNTCGYPVVYQVCPVYQPPLAIYLGGGRWGDDRANRGDRGDRAGRGDPRGRGGDGHDRDGHR